MAQKKCKIHVLRYMHVCSTFLYHHA